MCLITRRSQSNPAPAIHKNNDLQSHGLSETDHRVRGPKVGDLLAARALNRHFASDTRYTHRVIKSSRHDGLEKFFLRGSKVGIQRKHAKKLALQLTQFLTTFNNL
jgi:hypothetical protein